MHPNQQDISCPGCGKGFIRAGSLVDHLEKNECPGITIAHFDRYRTVHALREQFITTLSRDDDDGVSSYVRAQTATETTGGVMLERDEEHYAAAWPSLAPEPIPNPMSGSKEEILSRHRPGNLSAGTKKDTLLSGVTGTLSDFTESVRTTQGIIPLEQNGKWKEHIDDRKAKSSASARESSAAKTSFPDTTERNVHNALADMLIGTPQESTISRFSNGEPVDAANPDSRHYNPGAFKNFLGCYKCPYPHCSSVKRHPQNGVTHC